MVLLLYTVTEEQRWELVLWKVCRYSPVTLCLLFLQKTRFNFSAPSVLLCWLWNSLFITFPSYLAFIIIICAHLSRTETWFHFKNNLQLTSASVPVSAAVPLTPQAPFSTINTRHGSRAFLSDKLNVWRGSRSLLAKWKQRQRVIILWYYYYYHYRGMRLIPSRMTASIFQQGASSEQMRR